MNNDIDSDKKNPIYPNGRDGRNYPNILTLAGQNPSLVPDQIISKHKIEKQENSFSLDLGCGLRPRNPFDANNVFGVDINSSPGDLYVASSDLSCEKIPFGDNIFQFCTAYDFIEHIPRVQLVRGGFLGKKSKTIFPFIRLMNEIYRVIEPNGYFLHFTPAYPAKQVFQDPTHVNIITEETFPVYFCQRNSCSPMASMYGFQGSFRLLEQVWVSDVWLVGLLQVIK